MQDEVAYYDEHGLNQQRAYEIVCLMVGYDDQKFKDLAKETKLPQERQDTCAKDYSNIANSWDMVLQPHRRDPDQPRTKIDVVYAGRGQDCDRPASGYLDPAAGNGGRACGRRLRLAGSLHVGNAELRLAQRRLGPFDP